MATFFSLSGPDDANILFSSFSIEYYSPSTTINLFPLGSGKVLLASTIYSDE
uniref:Uncharacterized protein n=1 Tax=Podoviridae sp. ct8Lf7 TaxID=2827723 RepID=A0A8S5S118_9CAUD|nr:MAG TPA: hypothetical protein [Podoviridae sp. ct8Lf7]